MSSENALDRSRRRQDVSSRQYLRLVFAAARRRRLHRHAEFFRFSIAPWYSCRPNVSGSLGKDSGVPYPICRVVGCHPRRRPRSGGSLRPIAHPPSPPGHRVGAVCSTNVSATPRHGVTRSRIPHWRAPLGQQARTPCACVTPFAILSAPCSQKPEPFRPCLVDQAQAGALSGRRDMSGQGLSSYHCKHRTRTGRREGICNNFREARG